MPDRDPDQAPDAEANDGAGLTAADARIVHITLDERTVIRRSPEVEQERAIAVYDLLEENCFRPLEADTGPYHLHLRIEESRLILDVRDTGEEPQAIVALPRCEPLTASRTRPTISAREVCPAACPIHAAHPRTTTSMVCTTVRRRVVICRNPPCAQDDLLIEGRSVEMDW